MLPIVLCFALSTDVQVIAPPPTRHGHDFFGVAIEPAPDLDGDGVRDLWVGDPADASKTEETDACVHAVSTKTGLEIRRFPAPKGEHGFGWTLAGLGDVDGDGTDDVAVSSAGETYSRVFIVSGTSGALIWSVLGAADRQKEWWYSACAGPALALVDDWNGDHVRDLAIGWALAEANEVGRVQVFSGKDGTSLRSWKGDEASGRLGLALAALPDLDGDGLGDLAASAPGCSEGCDGGGKGSVLVLSSKGTVLRALEPDRPLSMFGASLALIADQDGDGVRDLAVGAPFGSKHAAELSTWSLATGKLVRALPAPALEAFDGGWESEHVGHTVPDNGADNAPLRILKRSFGTRLLAVPDRDGDGLEDVLATLPQPFCYVPAGVVSSSSAKMLGHVELSGRDYTWSHVGITAVTLENVDGDDVRDFALGGSSVRCSGCEGSVSIVSGKTLVPIRHVLRGDVEPKSAPK